MMRLLPLLVLLPLLASASSPAPRPVPALPRAPLIDGDPTDLKSGLLLRPTEGDAWSGRVAYRKDTLYLALEVANAGGTVAVTLHFPSAGTTAQGSLWQFTQEGLRGSHPLLQTKVAPEDGRWIIEAAIPARALPRFPSKDPLVFDLCVNGATQCASARLPDDFRKSLKLKVPESVVGIEGRPDGWVGYAVLHYPLWVSSDVPLDAQVLRRLVTDRGVNPRSAGINLPDALVLPDGQTLLSVLSGNDPYGVEGACDADQELRLALYLVRGQTAERVLEWPASTCALGRAAAVELDEHGELSLGYTNGATVTFQWSKDHFERTEIGSR